jgi:hypothetical protein
MEQEAVTQFSTVGRLGEMRNRRTYKVLVEKDLLERLGISASGLIL